MHCLSCDCTLTDFEATRKSACNGLFVDLCNTCFSEIEFDYPTIVRDDLLTPNDFLEGLHDD